MVQKSLSANFGPELLNFLQNGDLLQSTKSRMRDKNDSAYND